MWWSVRQRGTNEKPSAPCLMGKPEGIQQQPVHSTNMNTIVPEKTVSGHPLGAMSLNMGQRLSHSTCYCIHLK